MQHNAMLVPGEQLQTYIIYRRRADTDAKGRVQYTQDAQPAGTITGTLAATTQVEIERGKAMEHPVSHKIVCMGRNNAQPGDILERGAQRFVVQWVHDPMLLRLYTTVYCLANAG